MSDDHERTDPVTGAPSTRSAAPTGPSPPNRPERGNALPAPVDDDPEPITDILYSTRPAAASRDHEVTD